MAMTAPMTSALTAGMIPITKNFVAYSATPKNHIEGLKAAKKSFRCRW